MKFDGPDIADPRGLGIYSLKTSHQSKATFSKLKTLCHEEESLFYATHPEGSYPKTCTLPPRCAEEGPLSHEKPPTLTQIATLTPNTIQHVKI